MGTALSVPCTTKLAQTISQYYCVLQSLQKVLPSTTLYYRACTKYFPVLLCTTKLAQTTSQYYFVLQSLHKVRPSTTLWYKVCTQKAFTHSKLSNTASVYTQNAYTRCFYTWQAFTHTETFTQRSVYTQRSFYTQQAFTHKIFYTQQAFTEKSFYTEKLSCTLYKIAIGIAAPKLDLGANAKKRRFWSTFWKENC